MIDRIARDAAAARIGRFGRNAGIGRALEELHRQVGRYVAEHGINWLIGIGGQARAMVEAAVAAGLPRGRAHFFETPPRRGSSRG